MKICKDCIYYGVCDDFLPPDDCLHFKDKSKFIELPCPVGDTVYEIQDTIDWHLCENCEFYTEPWPGDPDCCEK